LQLITVASKSNNREQEISHISRRLKLMAKNLNVPIIALSQLSRAVEARSDKTPKLSDLRESGAIEQDADIVSFLYRPEYYNIYEDSEGNSLIGKMRVSWAKNRNGALDQLYLNFNKWTTEVTQDEVKKYDIPHLGDNGFPENEKSPF